MNTHPNLETNTTNTARNVTHNAASTVTTVANQKNLVLVFAILLITTWQCIDIYLPSIPSMTAVLHTTPAMLQLTITIAMIAYGIAAPIYGPLSDYYGRRHIAIIGLAIFVAGSICCLCANNIYLLVVGRALQGFGFASACSVAAPAVGDVFSGSELIKAYSYIGMAMAIVPVAAPVIGGYLHDYFNWRAPFALLLIYSATMLCLFAKFFPETKKTLRQGNLHPAQIARSYLAILVKRRFIGFVVCFTLIVTGEISYVVTAPFLFQSKLGFTAIQNGWLIVITVAGLLAGSFTSNKACKRFSIMQLLCFGCSLTIIGALIMLSCALAGKINVATIALPMMLYMYGGGIIYPNAIGGFISCAPENSGTVTALAATFQMGATGLITTAGTYFFGTEYLPLAVTLLTLATLALPALYLARVQAVTASNAPAKGVELPARK
jgi:MFS transporter, DHA1 family, 2-module integral membrane pump EmrD